MRLRLEYATRPKPGESDNGDAVILRQEGERTLFGIIDALGHGKEAALVAQRAKEFLQEAPLTEGIAPLFWGLHQTLQKSRGAAALLCLSADGQIEGAGVGNVELRAWGIPLAIRLTPGVLGHRLRSLHTFAGPLSSGARMIVFSDGISGRFSREEVKESTGEEAIRFLLEHYAKPHDDATALVVDVGEPVPEKGCSE